MKRAARKSASPPASLVPRLRTLRSEEDAAAPASPQGERPSAPARKPRRPKFVF